MELRQVAEVASGVDALYLSGATECSPVLLAQLAEARTAAQAEGESIEFDLGGSETRFHVAPVSFGKYQFRLDHPFGVVGITPSKSLPAIRIQPRAEYLHAVGPEVAAAWFMLEVSDGFGGLDAVAWDVCRLDLFCDIQGWDVAAADRAAFVGRAADTAQHRKYDELTGLNFGKRGGRVFARIYDKTVEASRKASLGIWQDRWEQSGGYVSGAPVWRVEFEMDRSMVRQLVPGTPDDVLAGRGGIWGYLADKWLTYRKVTEDSNRSRWPISGEWRVVQGASMRGEALGLERVQERVLTHKLSTLAAPLRGYAASVGALMDSPTLADAVRACESQIERLCRRDGKSFEDLMWAKRVEWGLT